MKKVLFINANPKRESFCASIAENYAETAALEHEVKQVHVSKMSFDMNLEQGYDQMPRLEPDLQQFQELVLWSDHIVIVTPVWWGSLPAKFKGLIDRVFLPNFAFRYVKGKSFPEKLLSGRSSELVVTLDTPPFWYKYVKGNLIYKHVKKAILDFSGIRNRSVTYFGPVAGSNPQTRQSWLEKTSKLASRLK
ncbi:NAD(P)H-dependent oxidoreductase [Vibrio nigripulchritudo]|uniref:NAD(P)H-dependent oxidoreductase n=1 Tax=Vibrio nigripulchritudo TaxID=28173 RepID=UPI0003B1E8F0|nr:NAD(P)H-dependent oxidoreductase [Vibrio nigripulchritudo]CCN72337.1 Putative NADPH-quinone reductase (modulator of drug activity B) [Vibrio nigripulchritudo SFn118]